MKLVFVTGTSWPAYDFAVLGNELNRTQGLDVLQRVARCRHDVGSLPGTDRAPLFVDMKQRGAVRGHGTQDVGSRDARVPPYLQVVEHGGGARASRDIQHDIGAEGELYPDAMRTPQPVDDLLRALSRVGQEAHERAVL